MQKEKMPLILCDMNYWTQLLSNSFIDFTDRFSNLVPELVSIKLFLNSLNRIIVNRVLFVTYLKGLEVLENL